MPVVQLAFAADRPRTVFAAVRQHGLLVSPDSGASWRLSVRADARGLVALAALHGLALVAAGPDGALA